VEYNPSAEKSQAGLFFPSPLAGEGAERTFVSEAGEGLRTIA